MVTSQAASFTAWCVGKVNLIVLSFRNGQKDSICPSHSTVFQFTESCFISFLAICVVPTAMAVVLPFSLSVCLLLRVFRSNEGTIRWKRTWKILVGSSSIY